MGDGYVIKNVLVWTASKLGDLAAQLAKQHVDIIDMVYTGCLDYATPRGGPTVFLGGFDFYAIVLVCHYVWKFLPGNQFHLFGVEWRVGTCHFDFLYRTHLQ